MRHIKEILRLKLQNQLSVREIARSCGIPISTVGDYIQRAQAADLTWPLPEGLSDSQLMERLFPPEVITEAAIKPLPNWSYIREELGRKSVTLRLLWQEYHQVHSTGYGYSHFCELYERWADTLDPVLRQTHEPGRKLFVDWAGQMTPIYHPDGTITQASLFVAVLGYSNKIFAEAFPDQQLASWISAHIRVFKFLEGVTAAVVPDNPKTAVIRANQYEPVLHRTYQEMAEHYGTVILPARPRKPRGRMAMSVPGYLLYPRMGRMSLHPSVRMPVCAAAMPFSLGRCCGGRDMRFCQRMMSESHVCVKNTQYILKPIPAIE